jgi:hypothetical protein
MTPTKNKAAMFETNLLTYAWAWVSGHSGMTYQTWPQTRRYALSASRGSFDYLTGFALYLMCMARSVGGIRREF